MTDTLFGAAAEPEVSRRKEAKRKPADAGLRIAFPPAKVTLPSERIATHEDTQAVRDVEVYIGSRASLLGLSVKASNQTDPTTGVKFRVIELLDDRHHMQARLFLTFYAPAMRGISRMLDSQLQSAGYAV
jgi:hypothetical protein